MKIFKENKYIILGNILKFGPVLVFSLILFGNIAFAVCPDGTNVSPCPTVVKVDAGIKNPLGEKLTDIPSFIKAIIEIVLVVGIPILALAIIYAGFLYVKAQGNPGELEVAHRTLLYTVIGGALLLGAFVIANAIGSTVKEIGNGA